MLTRAKNVIEFILQGLDSVLIKQMHPVRTYGSYWPNDRREKLCRVEESSCEGGLGEAFSNYRDHRTQVPEIYKKCKGSPWKEELKRNKTCNWFTTFGKEDVDGNAGSCDQQCSSLASFPSYDSQ